MKFFPFVADLVFKARCVACVSAMSIEVNFSSDADFVRFPVVTAALTPISLYEPSVYIYVIPALVFIIDNFIKSLLVSQSWCIFFREIS